MKQIKLTDATIAYYIQQSSLNSDIINYFDISKKRILLLRSKQRPLLIQRLDLTNGTKDAKLFDSIPSSCARLTIGIDKTFKLFYFILSYKFI